MIAISQKCVLVSVSFEAEHDQKKPRTCAGFALPQKDGTSRSPTVVFLDWADHDYIDRDYMLAGLGKFWLLEFASYEFAKSQPRHRSYSVPVIITALDREDDDQWHIRVMKGTDGKSVSCAFIQGAISRDMASEFGSRLHHKHLYINVRPVVTQDEKTVWCEGDDHDFIDAGGGEQICRKCDYMRSQLTGWSDSQGRAKVDKDDPNGTAERRSDLELPAGHKGGTVAGRLCTCHGRGCDRCLELGG